MTVARALYLCSHLLEFCSLQSAHPNPTLERPQSGNISCLLTPASFSLSPGTVSQNSELPNYLVCVQSFEGLASLSPSVANTPGGPCPAHCVYVPSPKARVKSPMDSERGDVVLLCLGEPI